MDARIEYLNNEQLNDLENELRNELIKREEQVNKFILEERKEDEKTLDINLWFLVYLY